MILYQLQENVLVFVVPDKVVDGLREEKTDLQYCEFVIVSYCEFFNFRLVWVFLWGNF